MRAEHGFAISTREALGRELTTGVPRWLPVAALLVFFGGAALVLAVAGETHGWDYVSYVNAANRFLAGEPIHDPTSDLTGGGQGIYLYPPAFAIVMVPFALVPPEVALWAWTAVIVAAFLLGALLLPVRPWVRWAVILLGGLSWPLLYSIKLGQVETLLFLAAAVGWRWMERPPALGLSIAAGAVIKLQPIALLGWAVARRRWRAAAIGVGALALVALLTTLLAPGSWADFVETLRQVGTPVTRPHNFSPGAVSFRLGASEELATAIQWISVGAAGLVTIWSWFRLPPVPSYLITLLAVQIASPLLRDHYVLLLLLPAAWLMDSGRWWGALLALAYPLLAVTIIPAAAYPIGFWVGIVTLLYVGWKSGLGAAQSPAPHGG